MKEELNPQLRRHCLKTPRLTDRGTGTIVCVRMCVCCTGLVGEVVISLKQFQTYKNTSE